MSSPPPSGGANRRIFFRLPVRLDIQFRWVSADGEHGWLSAAVEDLSAGGMRMASGHLDSVDEDTVLSGAQGIELLIELDDADEALCVPAKVAWLERGDDGIRRAGLRFDPLSGSGQEALDRFVLDRCRQRPSEVQ